MYFVLTKLSVWILLLVLVYDHCGSCSTIFVEHFSFLLKRVVFIVTPTKKNKVSFAQPV
jgi:hypothetical protein